MTPTQIALSHYTLPFELKPFQVEVVNDLGPLDEGGYYLDMGCVDADTEYLSPYGWKRIADYDGGQVMQFTPAPGLVWGKGSGEFVIPSRYIAAKAAEMIHIKNGYGVDQVLSLDHKVAYADYRGAFKTTTAAVVKEKWETLDNGFVGSLPTTFGYMTDRSMPIPDSILRLTVAIIADGHFAGTDWCAVRVKKTAKIARFEQLLKDVGIEYKRVEEPWKNCEGFVRFSFYSPLKYKTFGPEFWDASVHQLEVIVDELKYWDASIDPRDPEAIRFFTSIKESADFVHFAYSALGIRASMNYKLRVREGRKDSHEYWVQTYKAGRKLACITPRKFRADTIKPFTPADGMQYCFTVPSGFLVLRRGGCVFITGNCGKTACSTVAALFRKLYYQERCVVIMPPILLKQWETWLKSIKPCPSVVKYAGTPSERAAMSLDADFVLVGIQIFKKEYDRFMTFFQDKQYVTIVDEATMISNIGTDNHEKVYDFTLGRPRLMLTGTPMNNPEDAYGLLKFVAPGLYRNKTAFLRIHGGEKDFFGNYVSWQNLDLLAKNMAVNSKRILLADVYDQMPEISYTPVNYDLDPKHLKLYRKLAEEELLKLPDGGKIDATQATKLVHALGQIVANWGHFAGDSSLEANIVELIKEKLDELGGGKLLIFAHYKMTVALLAEKLAKYGVVTVNSEVTQKQKENNLERFKTDPKCRVMIAQVKSAGYGLDKLQTVCNHVLYAEPCTSPRDFHQANARLIRLGQTKPVQVYMAVASGTLQARSFDNLVKKDEIVNQVIRNVADLRDMIFGG